LEVVVPVPADENVAVPPADQEVLALTSVQPVPALAAD
jgi:hypothetical protein